MQAIQEDPSQEEALRRVVVVHQVLADHQVLVDHQVLEDHQNQEDLRQGLLIPRQIS